MRLSSEPRSSRVNIRYPSVMSSGSWMPGRSTSSPAAFRASQNSAQASPDTTLAVTSSVTAILLGKAGGVGGEALAYGIAIEAEPLGARVVGAAAVLWVVAPPGAHARLRARRDGPAGSLVDPGDRRQRFAYEVVHPHVDERIVADHRARGDPALDALRPPVRLPR